MLADDDPRWNHGPVEQARFACRGGARVIQLRAKHATDRVILEWARAIREITLETATAFVVNDRFDLALLAKADGVHLGQNDLPVSAIPAEARKQLAVGRSTHTLEQALAAAGENVDYVAFGPVFNTHSKDTGYIERGCDALRKVAAGISPRTLVAIGGIDAENAADVRSAGASGIAVISAVSAAANPSTATRELVAAFATRTEREQENLV